MKKLIGLLMLSMVLILAACGGEGKETTEKEIESVTSKPKETKAKEKEVEAEDESEKQELNQEIADTDNIKATLISIEKVVNPDWDEEKYEVKFEVENKRDDNIGVQAREVSADGKMINESMLSMSTDISAGKKADAVLTIENYDGDLPEINENFEMVLHVYTDEDYETVEDHKVVVEMK